MTILTVAEMFKRKLKVVALLHYLPLHVCVGCSSCFKHYTNRA